MFIYNQEYIGTFIAIMKKKPLNAKYNNGENCNKHCPYIILKNVKRLLQ